jgi:hypothetical protein
MAGELSDQSNQLRINHGQHNRSVGVRLPSSAEEERTPGVNVSRFADSRNFSGCDGFSPTILASCLRNARRGSMTDQPGATKDGVCRRSLLKSIPMIAGAIVSATAIPDSVFAQTKVSHEVSKYQDQPKNGQQCSTCVQFEPPSACKIVESPISPTAWCQLYMAKPA